MPVLEVCPDAAQAQSGHRCDLCKLRPGRSWWGVLWLCALCRHFKDTMLEQERLAK